MQSSVEVPEAVKGLNWGAFLLNWIWGIGNQVWLALAALIPCVNLFVAIYLLLKGNELAWQARQWESVEQFHEVQRKWAIAGVVVLVVSVVLNVVLSMMGFGLAMLTGGATSGGGGGY